MFDQPHSGSPAQARYPAALAGADPAALAGADPAVLSDADPAALADLPVGPELFARLCALDPAAVPADGTASVARCWERVLAHVQSHVITWTEALARREYEENGLDELALDKTVALRLGISAWEAEARRSAAMAFAGPLPGVGEALARGELQWAKARAITSELAGLAHAQPDRARVADAESCLMALARRAGPGKLRREAARLARDFGVAELAHLAKPLGPPSPDRSLTLRHGSSMHAPGDYLVLDGWLPWDGAALLAEALDRLAGGYCPEDGRRIEVRRADALLELARRYADSSAVPPVSGSRAAVNVVVPLATLAGGDAPGEAGGVPLPAETVRRMACDGAWFTRLVTDPMTGRLLDYGRTRRDPTDRLRGYLVARDQHCQFPDCTRPAHRCDIHHCVWWSRGGPTDRVNCFALCPTHHAYVHEGGWRARRHPDESTTWIDPRGHRYHVSPPAVLAGEALPARLPLPGSAPDRPAYPADGPGLLEWLTTAPEPWYPPDPRYDLPPGPPASALRRPDPGGGRSPGPPASALGRPAPDPP